MKSLGLLLITSFLSFSSFSQEWPDSCFVFVPNSLTPDCDDIDCQILEITCNCAFETFHLIIFSKWGDVVFESRHPTKKFNADGLPYDFYTWKLDAQFCNRKQFLQTGNISILR